MGISNIGDSEKYIDMHTHSTVSDGSMTPSELVRYAYEKGLAAVALTDHDTVDGVEQACEEGGRIGIEVVAGVEISVSLSLWDIMSHKETVMSEPEMHLLGYFFSRSYCKIMKTLEVLQKKREQRNHRSIEKLNELGFDINMDEVVHKAADGIVGRPHIARVLMEKGYINSISEGFEKYLAFGRPAYFKKEKLTPEEGISEIIRSGGVPVLAHPIYLGVRGIKLDRVLEKLKAAGLKGLEALYSENTEEQTVELLQHAKKHGLSVTGGSDFHGSYKPDIEIGIGRGDLKVPYRLLSELKEA